MQVIFSFDTEEYETPGVDDTVKIWADMLARHNFRGTFCTVGEKARVLRARGRKDIIDALAHHEIDYHSNHHSEPPLHAEYLDEMTWQDGVNRVLQEETPGIRDVETILGQRPIAYCKPGGSWAPQVAHAMAQLGLPVFCDAPFEYAPGQPLWYCNQLFLGYHMGFDSYFDTPNRLTQMKTDFHKLCDQIGNGTLVIYTHPVRLFTKAFTHNFRYGQNTPKSQWVPAPMRSKSQIDELIHDFTAFVAHIAAENIPVIDYEQLHKQYRSKNTWTDLTTVTELALKIQQELTYHTVKNATFSPAEIFALITFALNAHHQTGSLPQHIPIRQPIGPTKVLKYETPTTPINTKDTLSQITHINEDIDNTGTMPSAIILNHQAISPGVFLKACAQILHAHATQTDLPKQLTLDPTFQTPTLSKREDIANHAFHWSMFSPGFEGKNVLEMTQLQTWTAKPAN